MADTSVGVLDRTMTVLEAVERGARSFTQIVEATGFTRSTTHRLVKALEEHGLLLMAAGGRGYRLGPRLLGLAAAAMRDLPLRDLAHPALERLARDTAESAQLYVRDGDRRVCIDAVESTAELRTIVAVGASLPLTKGSAGKVFLTWADPRERERLLATNAKEAPALERRSRPRGGADGPPAWASARPAWRPSVPRCSTAPAPCSPRCPFPGPRTASGREAGGATHPP